MLETGDYPIVLDLEPGREYQVRYANGSRNGKNDWEADKYVKNPYGDSYNLVFITEVLSQTITPLVHLYC